MGIAVIEQFDSYEEALEYVNTQNEFEKERLNIFEDQDFGWSVWVD